MCEHVVDTLDRTCTYGEWQVSSLPCGHVVASCIEVYGHHTIWEVCISDYLTVERLMHTYIFGIEALSDRIMWPNPSDMGCETSSIR